MGSTPERRKHKRHQYEAIISHDILSSEIRPAGKMYNFSKRGLYFESRHNFLPLEEIFVEIIDRAATSETDLELLFDVQIVWRKKLQDSPFPYGYGARFKFFNDAIENKIKAARIKQVPFSLPQTAVTNESEARQFPRRPCRKAIVFRHGQQVCNGWMTSISRGGAFIKTRNKVPLGREIRIVFTARKTTAKAERLGWIVRVDSEGFGISFDRRSGAERRYDLDRRFGGDRRKKKFPPAPDRKTR